MKKRYIAICAVSALLAVGAGVGLFLIKDEKPEMNESEIRTPVKSVKSVKVLQADSSETKIEEPKKKSDIAFYTQYEIPLISINELQKLPENVKNKANEILEKSMGAYYIKYKPDIQETEMLVENYGNDDNRYIRHNLQFISISHDGHVKVSEAGYSGEDGETSNAVEQTNDVWEFDNTIEPPRPLKHTAFNSKGKILFTEIWHYNENEPIKYEMKNGKGRPISVLKETQNGESDYRREHVFYEENGKTSASLSAGYKDSNLSHFSFYSAKNPEDTVIIESEFLDGLKTGEKIYNNEFVQINTVKAEYTEGELSDIEVSEPVVNQVSE